MHPGSNQHELQSASAQNADYPAHPARPFRAAVFRGLAVVTPPLLTILIFVWVINTTRLYVLDPVTGIVREVIVWRIAEMPEGLPLVDPAQPVAIRDGRRYRQMDDEKFVPLEIYEMVRKASLEQQLPQTALGVYRRYVDLRYLRPQYTVPLFIAFFVLLMYFLGRFMAAGIGAFFWERIEQGFRRLPLVRSVYSGAKQVSDFIFTRHQIKATRIVAVEYPRKGTWAIGFVTGESFVQLENAVQEPVYAVLVPYSPIPHTGATVVVARSECIELDMTVDQALQFIISCGVVVPPHQIAQLAANGVRASESQRGS
jgi:uncharacterized membrane protein